MFRSFIIGMVATALAITPATPALSLPTKGSVSPSDIRQAGLKNDLHANFKNAAKQTFDEFVSIVEAGFDDPSLYGGSLASLGDELDELFLHLTGRQRADGEVLFTLTESPNGPAQVCTLDDGKSVEVSKISTTYTYDTGELSPGADDALALVASHVDRTLYTVEGNGESRIIDAFTIYPYEEDNHDFSAFILPLSSVVSSSSELPWTSQSRGGFLCAFSIMFAIASFMIAVVGAIGCFLPTVFTNLIGCGWMIGFGFTTVSFVTDAIQYCGVQQPPTMPEFEASLNAILDNTQ